MAEKPRRKIAYGINLAVMVIAVASILGVLNWLGTKHYKRFNLSEPTSEALSDQTIQVMKSLDKDVTLTYIYTQPYSDEAQETLDSYTQLLERYKSISNRFSYEMLDYAKNPTRVENFVKGAKDINIEDGVSIIKSDKYVEKINDTSEASVTQAIIKVTTGMERTVCFTEGHGERDPDRMDVGGYSTARKYLESENYAIEKVNALRKYLPEKCNVIVVAGPLTPFEDIERERLKKWLDAGGKALFLLDPAGPTALEPLFEEYGIIVKDDVLKTEDAAAMGIDPFEVFSEEYDSIHPITEALSQTRFMMGDALRKIPLRMVEARSLELAGKAPDSVETTSLISTIESVREFPSSEGPTMRSIRRNRALDESAPKGPLGDVGSFIVAAVAKKTIEKESKPATAEINLNEETNKENQLTARLVVYGDADWVADGYIESMPNGDLFMNTIAWLSEEEQTIGIRPREKKFVPINFSGGKNWLFLAGVLLLAPAVLVLNAIFVWREKKRM